MKYKVLSEYYLKLEKTSKRLEKTKILTDLLKKTEKNDLDKIILLIQGRVFPQWDSRVLGISDKLILKVMSSSSGNEIKKINQLWREIGDLGEVAYKIFEKKKQSTLFSQSLTVKKVFENLQKIASIEGLSSTDKKLQLVAELLSNAEGLEAKYIVRTCLMDLRVGIGEGTLRDAIIWSFLLDPEDLNLDGEIEILNREKYNRVSEITQRAYDLTTDFSTVALMAAQGIKELKNARITLFKPVKVMLAIKAKDVKDALERVGIPCMFERKYDGFRIQVNRDGEKIRLYTRRLDDVTDQFPDIVKAVRDNVKAKKLILDSEAVGYDVKTKKYLPFQKISQRIKRKYDIEKMTREFPVELNVFDILYLEGENLIEKPFSDRRKLLESVVFRKDREIQVSEGIIVNNEKEGLEFFEDSLNKGFEGVMAKNLASPYKPGSRVGHMVKLKSVMETLDLVIVGGEWGKGKRSGWITSLILACRNVDGFKPIGKVGTGLKEKREEGLSFSEITELLRPLIKKENGREIVVEPKIIVEIAFEEIQKSPSYESGYALRFPRVIRLRDDKNLDEVSDIDLIEEFYFSQ